MEIVGMKNESGMGFDGLWDGLSDCVQRGCAVFGSVQIDEMIFE